MEERFVIKRKDFKKLERYAENIYNTAVVIDYFCSSQKEYEELYNLSPVVKNLRRDADQVNAFFINYPENIDYLPVLKVVLFYQYHRQIQSVYQI